MEIIIYCSFIGMILNNSIRILKVLFHMVFNTIGVALSDLSLLFILMNSIIQLNVINRMILFDKLSFIFRKKKLK